MPVDMPMNEQMELNIDQRRLDEKVAIYKMKAKKRKHKIPTKLKKQIKDRAAALEAQFKTKE